MESGDIKWLAGLLEGEGSFYIKPTGARQAKVTLEMCDKDVVERAYNLLRVKSAIYEPKNKLATKPSYRFAVYSSQAIGLMMTLYSQMGLRRQAKIREIIVKWKSYPSRVSTRGVECAFCKRPSRSKGLCHAHYMQAQRLRRAA